MAFEGYFENNNEDQIVSRFTTEVGHRLRLRGLLNYLTKEQRIIFINSIFFELWNFCKFNKLVFLKAIKIKGFTKSN